MKTACSVLGARDLGGRRPEAPDLQPRYNLNLSPSGVSAPPGVEPGLSRPIYESTPRCSVPGCDHPHRAKGYCSTHYNQVCRGEAIKLPYTGPSFIGYPRFDSKVKVSETRSFNGTQCWEWQGRLVGDGYGQFRFSGQNRTTAAHRFSYMTLVGPIPDGLVIDHLCRNTACVNPSHLEPVTNSENVQRGYDARTGGVQQIRKTHCPKGHEYTDDNIKWTITKGRRYRTCRPCVNTAQRAKWALNKTQQPGASGAEGDVHKTPTDPSKKGGEG